MNLCPETTFYRFAVVASSCFAPHETVDLVYFKNSIPSQQHVNVKQLVFAYLSQMTLGR